MTDGETEANVRHLVAVPDAPTEASNSEVQAYMDCRRRWKWSYYDRLRPRRERPVGPLALGSRVHKALEQGYSSPGREADMRRVLAETIEADYPLARELQVVDEFEKECELAIIMLEGFVEWAAEEGLDAGWEVVSHEQVVRSPPIRVGDAVVVLKGKLDQLVRREHDDSVWFRDWKTAQTLKVPTLHMDPQMRMYKLLLSLTEPDSQVSGGQYVMLRKVRRTASAKPPFYGIEEVRLSSTEMESFWMRLTGTLGDMVATRARLDAGEDDRSACPPRPNRDCAWRCPFFEACTMRDDGSHYERYLADRFEVGDPYDYYEENTTTEGDEPR
jgi:hypothetical protein